MSLLGLCFLSLSLCRPASFNDLAGPPIGKDQRDSEAMDPAQDRAEVSPPITQDSTALPCVPPIESMGVPSRLPKKTPLPINVCQESRWGAPCYPSVLLCCWH